MKYPVDNYDMILVHCIHDKLDAHTSKDWELARRSETPKLKHMLHFLQQHGRALSSAQYNDYDVNPNRDNRKRSFHGKNDHQFEHKKSKMNVSKGFNKESKPSSSAETRKCKICNAPHAVHQCPKFKSMDLNTRRDRARSLNLCYNCLFPSHSAQECKASACKRCVNKKHNSLLCSQNPYNEVVNTVQVKPQRSKAPKKQFNRTKKEKVEKEQ